MQYPSGHLAHLTENQQAQLQAFEKLAQEQGYYTPGTETTEASHDDETMLYAHGTSTRAWRGTNRTQSVPARASLRAAGSLQAIQRHRGLAQRAEHHQLV